MSARPSAGVQAWDVFRCPHDDCALMVCEPCRPHTEAIGDESEVVGRHCWDDHRCVLGHPDAWTHEPGAFAPRPCPDEPKDDTDDGGCCTPGCENHPPIPLRGGPNA